MAESLGVEPSHAWFKTTSDPVSPTLYAFAGTSDLHYYLASTTLLVTPMLNPAKFILHYDFCRENASLSFQTVSVHGGYRAP